jgi:hypothetical protein
VAKSSATIIGRDLIAAWVSLLSHRSGISTSWVFASEGPKSDPFGPTRLVSPLAWMLKGNQGQSLRKVLANTQKVDFRLDNLREYAFDLPGKLLALAVGRKEMDESHRAILAAFFQSSLKEYDALKGTRAPLGSAWQASPMAIFAPGHAAAREAKFRQEAEQAGIPLEEKTGSFLGTELANVTAAKILVATKDCFSVDVAQMISVLRKTFLDEGGTLFEPDLPGQTGPSMAKARTMLADAPVVVTDVETSIAWFGKLPRALPLGKMEIARRHFSARHPLPTAMMDLNGEFVARPAARGVQLMLPPMTYLSPAGPKRQLDQIASNRLSLLLGEPRDEMEVVQMRQLADNLPFLGEVPDRKGLWLAAGAGDLDAALAPALALVLIRQIFGKPDPLISRYLGAERFALRDPFGGAKATE